jgi:predicted transcriptional regulator
MKNRSLTIRLDNDLEQELEAVCSETGRSRGDIVRDALRRQLQLMRSKSFCAINPSRRGPGKP